MPIASLKVSGDKPGGSVPVKNICWHTATKKRYLQAQPLPWSRPQHIRRTGDPASPLALQIGGQALYPWTASSWVDHHAPKGDLTKS